MAAAGAISSIIGSASSLIGGSGGGGTQYVPNYKSENMVNQAYLDFLSESYDQQLSLTNSQYNIDSQLTDLQYKMYVEQLAADRQTSYQDLYNSYLQSVAESYMTETSLEMENLQNIYNIESQKAAANMEYTNTLESISNARLGRSLLQDTQEKEYELGKEQIKRGINQTIEEKELSDQNYQLQRSDINNQLDNLTENEKQLYLQKSSNRDSLSSQLSGLNASRAEVQNQLASNVSSIESQRQQLMNTFLAEQTQQLNALSQMNTQRAGMDVQEDPRLQERLANDQDAQNTRQANLSQLDVQRGLSENSANFNMSQADIQEELARRNYDRSQSAADSQLAQSNIQRDSMMNQANQLSLSQQATDLQYQNTLANQYDAQQSFLNSYYQNYINTQLSPELASQLNERSANQNYNLTMGSLDMSDLQRQYAYDVNKSSIEASRALDEANYNSYYDVIGSNYDYNKASALASYWSDLASNATNRASTISGLGSSYSSQMSNVAASTRSNPQVSTSGGGSGFNFGGLAKGLSGLISSFGGNNSSSSSSNLYVTSNYGTYTPYNASSYNGYWNSGNSYSGYYNG